MYKELGLSFTKFRLDKGLTPADISKQANIPLLSVHKIESGELGRVKLEHIVAACKVVGCTFHVGFKNRDVEDKTGRDSES